MSNGLEPAVGLLERAVGYARGRLAQVSPRTLDNPTPCRAWDLGQLLEHMDDALDAFTEASAGTVELTRSAATGDVRDRIRTKACDLLGAWSRQSWQAPVHSVVIGERRLSPLVLVDAGALEITVHGWDVGQATGHPVPIPDDLARLLLPIAGTLVTAADRPTRFGPSIPQPGCPQPWFPQPGCPQTGFPQSRTSMYGVELLGFLGRIA